MAANRINEVQRLYTRLWNRFSEAASSDGGLDAKSSNGQGALVRHAEAKKNKPPQAYALIALPQWRYKTASDKRRVDIVIQVEETLSADFSAITKCTTQVGYFQRDEEGASNRIMELHYDFTSPVDEAHPVFHAQYDKTKWPAADLRDLGVRLAAIGDESSEGTYGKARIPTAYVGFAQILTVVAADHLHHRAYRQVLEGLRAVHGDLPRVQCGEFGIGVTGGSLPGAHHWYEHRYVATVGQVSRKGPWRAKISLLGAAVDGPTRAAAESELIAKTKLARDQIRFVLDDAG